MSISYAALNDFENAEYYLSEPVRTNVWVYVSRNGYHETEFYGGTDFILQGGLSVGNSAIIGGYGIARKLENIRFQLDIIYLLTDEE